MNHKDSIPAQYGFRYEVKLEISIPLGWAQLLKESAKHHYDMVCNEAGAHGVINGLFNTALGGEFSCALPVSWRDLNLTTKVAEQLEYHTRDLPLVCAIREWLRKAMDLIEEQQLRCLELSGTAHDL